MHTNIHTRALYNCIDSYNTQLVATELYKLLSENRKLFEFYQFQQNELMPCLVEMMERGVKIDLGRKEKLKEELKELSEKAKATLQWLVDDDTFNPKSSVQIKKLFKELLGVKPVIAKSGSETFGYDAMLEYNEKYPMYSTLITLLLEYRSINIFLSNFLEMELDSDDRMRCDYKIAATKTYRLGSTKNVFGKGGNLQTIPEKGKLDLKYVLEDSTEYLYTELNSSLTKLPNCKKIFIPDPGYTFFDIDYSGADAMVVAADSGCEWLLNFFATTEQKLYCFIGEYVLQREMTPKDPMYKKFKQFIHLTNYGGAKKKAAVSAQLPLNLADAGQKYYFKLCPEIPEWHKRIKSEIFTRGYIENVFGARGYQLDKNNPTILNQAYAWIPQSTIGILVNKGIVNISKGALMGKNNETIQTLLQTHDSASGQFPTKDLDAPRRIKEYMAIPLDYPNPITIPAGLKTSVVSYGDCE